MMLQETCLFMWIMMCGVGANGAVLLQVPVATMEERRCFSVLAEAQSLHLELPKGGNGRSRREWMDAIAGLDMSDIAERPDDANRWSDLVDSGSTLDRLADVAP